jgi:hypothetical protein
VPAESLNELRSRWNIVPTFMAFRPLSDQNWLSVSHRFLRRANPAAHGNLQACITHSGLRCSKLIT